VTLAGTAGEKGHEGDGGPGAKAKFNGMHSLAVGPDGGVYLADTWNNRVRKFDPKSGTVSTFAGTGEKGFSGDGGPAVKAKFGGCFCVSFDPAGKNLYVTDLDNRRIRKVDLASGVVTTVAGNGQRGVPKDGEEATKQPLVDPRAHAVDAKGNLYILERGGHALRVVGTDGRIRTVAGTGKAGMGSGNALAAAMNGPKHLCIDRDGTVLIADTENHRIVRYVPGEGKVVVVAGTGKKGTAGVGGDPLKAEFNQPHGVIVHPKTGEVYISDATNGRVLKVVRE
jgi:DNA-binding beta-propeller fold protein YncE